MNRIQSSRRLERESRRNVELVWLTGRLSPDFKTSADFRKDNGLAIRRVCSEFMALCRRLKLFSEALVSEERVAHIQLKMNRIKAQVRRLKGIGKQLASSPDGQIGLTDGAAGP